MSLITNSNNAVMIKLYTEAKVGTHEWLASAFWLNFLRTIFSQDDTWAFSTQEPRTGVADHDQTKIDLVIKRSKAGNLYESLSSSISMQEYTREQLRTARSRQAMLVQSIGGSILISNYHSTHSPALERKPGFGSIMATILVFAPISLQVRPLNTKSTAI